MFRLIYISGQSIRFSGESLQELLAEAREKNLGLGITGLLLYKHGNFLQVLEGEEQVVKDLFETIRQDPRHRRVIPVLEEPITERDFPDWSMAFREIDADTQVPPGFSDFLQIPWENLDVKSYSDTIKRFLRVFMVATS